MKEVANNSHFSFSPRYKILSFWKRSGKYLESALPVFIIGSVFGWCALLMTISYFNRPISDDYLFSMISPSTNPLVDGISGFFRGNGRFGQYFFFSLYQAIFGLDRAVKIAPLINTLLLFLSIATMLTVISKNYLKSVGLRKSTIINIAALMTFVVVFSARSIFDSTLWLDSSVAYIPSLVFLFFDVAIFLYVCKKRTHNKILWLSALFVTVLLGQQFNEPTGAIIITGFAICVAFSLLLFRSALTTSLTGLAAAILGLSMIFLSPGSTARRGDYHSVFNVHDMFISSLKYFEVSYRLIFSWRLMLYIALGLVIAHYYSINKISKRNFVVICVLSAALILIPYYVLFIVSQYSLPGYIALRTYQTPAALAGIGIVLFISSAAIMIHNKIQGQSRVYLKRQFTAITLIAIFGAFAASFLPLTKIVKATAIRSVQYDYRTNSINRQINKGSEIIYVYPAPLLLHDAEPGEFLYREEGQIDWFNSTFIEYYRLQGKKLIVKNQQISPYCLPGEDLPWWNIKSCENLTVDN